MLVNRKRHRTLSSTITTDHTPKKLYHDIIVIDSDSDDDNCSNSDNSDVIIVNENYNYTTSASSIPIRRNSLPQLELTKSNYYVPLTAEILKLPELKPIVIPHTLNMPSCDDKDGHYVIKVGEQLTPRYKIKKLLGQGTFGKVIAAYDKQLKTTVAIKIIRNIAKYREASKIELRVLSTLAKYDPSNVNNCIHLRECFDYRGHICIVTDLLKISLYDFLENNKFKPFPGSHIQAISKQLIKSVCYLHDLGLIHTDLKPENILLVDDLFKKVIMNNSGMNSSNTGSENASTTTTMKQNSKTPKPKTTNILISPRIQTIDYGSTTFASEYHPSIVSTRHYRAPEIILTQSQWSYPIDLWSIGCVLVELATGEALFRTHENYEHLGMMQKITGKRIPNEMGLKAREWMLSQGTDTGISNSQWFDEDGSLIWPPPVDVCVCRNDGGPAKGVRFNNKNFNEVCYRCGMKGFRMKDEVKKLKVSISAVDKIQRLDVLISSKLGFVVNLDYALNESYNYCLQCQVEHNMYISDEYKSSSPPSNNPNAVDFDTFTFWFYFIKFCFKLLEFDPEKRIDAFEAINDDWFELGINDDGTLN